eukprot:8529273-Pyramimonas_sp.AAC.1
MRRYVQLCSPIGQHSAHSHCALHSRQTPEQLLHTGFLHAPSGPPAFPRHLLPARGAQLGLGFQQASIMETALLLLEVDLAPDLGILGLPLLDAFDLGRTK